MGKRFFTIQWLSSSAPKALSAVALCAVLSSCASMNNQPILVDSKSAAKPSKLTSPLIIKSSQRVASSSSAPVKIAKAESAPTILGVKVPASLSFSHLTRFLSSKDESLDQPPAPLPSFPTVQETPPLPEGEIAIDTATIEDERSMLLLNEAERFAEFSENKTLSEIARGSLNRTPEISKPIKAAETYRLSHSVMVILALCIGVLVTCGYFVVSYILDEMRFRNTAPRFGSRF